MIREESKLTRRNQKTNTPSFRFRANFNFQPLRTDCQLCKIWLFLLINRGAVLDESLVTGHQSLPLIPRQFTSRSDNFPGVGQEIFLESGGIRDRRIERSHAADWPIEILERAFRDDVRDVS